LTRRRIATICGDDEAQQFVVVGSADAELVSGVAVGETADEDVVAEP
jgi:hypothetical protein